MPRVAVTASIEASAGMAAELVAVGLRPVALPCVRIQQADDVDLVRARASAEEADLIVIGVRRRSSLGKLILGSNAQAIIMEAPCPVVTIRAE